ncbi:PP2C family protein-serine/threonine phosphatase [Roseimaritima sediminicola]|uniref:PP2C family protein-serine/threonine phosphatase n=1 Tax=Roseimaritima sediminicola TaxID=2662066 RepID=UPI00129852D5|nr:PP2C family protein-serine/threonine phosphatase [Roseimaritima sediminicola]
MNKSDDELAAEVAALREELAEKEAEIDKMGEIHQTLLPDRSPIILGFDIATSHVAPEKAGGDYYDFIPSELRDDLSPDDNASWLIILADVSGHGPAASVIMAMVHSVLHAYDGARQNPGDVLSYINEQLSTKELEHFVTGLLIVINPLDPVEGRFTIAIAGHHPPLLRHADGRVAALPCEAGLPLAVDEATTYRQFDFVLQEGDAVLLFTDGLIEPMNADGEEFGMDGVIKAFEDCPGTAAETVRCLNRTLARHRGSEDQPDDKTLVCIRRTPVA